MGFTGRRHVRHGLTWGLPFLATVLFASTAACVRADDNSGPVRLARFSYLAGSVTWHYGNDDTWANATRNLPLRESAQVWTGDSSRAEIEFDDGARLRLDSNTLATLQTLYSDAQGEYTEITLNNGSTHLHLKNRFSIYQVNTPYAALKAAGPARIRISAGDTCEFEQLYGSSTVEGNGGSTTLQGGQALFLNDPNSPYQVSEMSQPDAWDTWNAARDARIDDPDRNQYLPPNIALECADLEKHGSWHRDRQYGWVWAPTVTTLDWRPYGAGSWTWVQPFGWTWVSADAWGWAPYHYGTWIHAEYGWAWVPGPANQYWCPAVVSFYQAGNGIAWVPLAPREVRYPAALTLGFQSGAWSAYFSIGGAAAYYPGSGNYCEARPWTTTYVNGWSRLRSGAEASGGFVAGGSFVASNARFGGGTLCGSQEFGGRGNYQQIRSNQAAAMLNGHGIAPMGAGSVGPVGLPGIHPSQASMAPEHAFVGRPPIPQNITSRPVFRTPLPKSVPVTQPAQSGQRLVSVSATRIRPPGIKRDGSGYSTKLRTGSTAPSPGAGSSSGLDSYLRSRNTSVNQQPIHPVTPVHPTAPASSGPGTVRPADTPPARQVDRTPSEPRPASSNPPTRTPVPQPSTNPPGGGNRGGGGNSGGGSNRSGGGSGGGASNHGGGGNSGGGGGRSSGGGDNSTKKKGS